MSRSRAERRDNTHKWKIYVCDEWGPDSIKMHNYRSVPDYWGKRDYSKNAKERAEGKDRINEDMNDSI